MKKTLLLALAVCSVSLAGCADDAAETDTTIVDTPGATTETAPMDDMMEDTTGMMEDDMMMEGDSAAMGDDAMMENETMSDTTGM